jgi:hypothetical protein
MGNRVSAVGPIAPPPTSADLAHAIGTAMKSKEEKLHEVLLNLKDAKQINTPCSGELLDPTVLLGRIIPIEPSAKKN